MNKKPENKKGGAQQESMLIKYYADQWCRDNGYPLQERKRTYKTVSRRPSSAVTAFHCTSAMIRKVATKAAPATLVRARKAWGPND